MSRCKSGNDILRRILQQTERKRLPPLNIAQRQTEAKTLKMATSRKKTRGLGEDENGHNGGPNMHDEQSMEQDIAEESDSSHSSESEEDENDGMEIEEVIIIIYFY